MKKIWCLLLVAVLLVAGCASNVGRLQKRDLKIATGGTGGTYYPLGLALQDILEKNRDCRVKVLTTSGATQNARLLYGRQADLAFMQGDIAYYAVHAQGMFAGANPMTDLRCLCTLYPEIVQIMVAGESGIRSISDLRGKKVVVGAADNSNAQQILEAYGMTLADIEPLYMSFSRGSEALLQREVDAVVMVAGYPTPAAENLGRKMELRLLPIDDEHAQKLRENYPFFTLQTIPSSNYCEGGVPGVGVQCMLVTTTKMDKKDGVQILQLLYDHPVALRRVSAAANAISRETGLEGMSITGHDGASVFFLKH